MSRNSQLLIQLLDDYTWIHAAWWDNPADPKELHLVHRQHSANSQVTLPNDMNGLRIVRHVSAPIRTLEALVQSTDPTNTHQACQDEPVQLGCQCQPQNANWVGTAGAPVSWDNLDGKRLWGFLSNWHVLASGQEQEGRTIHQPTTVRGAFAKLSDWKAISTSSPNLFDAAIADTLVDDYHTISSRILDLGDLCATPIRAQVGLEVLKSGRTTGLTSAICTATGAAVRVGYGDFTANFEDQDVYLSTGPTFSAPGDSGSLIVDRTQHCPVSLLFAGSMEITIGNPIHHVIEHFGLSFNLH